MARTCSVCAHPEREAIEKALAAGETFRGIARRFAASADAIGRHNAEHMPAVLARAKEARAQAHAAALGDQVTRQDAHEQAHALDVMTELERCFTRVNMLFDACHAWLLDPDDASRYYLGPRADDVKVVYWGRDRNGQAVTKKAPLSEVLARVEDAGVRVERWETKCADPRELALKVAAQLKGQTELLAKLMGDLQQEGTVNIAVHPEWVKVRATLISALAPFPAARVAVAESLVALESEAVGGHAGG